MQLYPHSYCTLVSLSTDEVIVGPSDEDKARGRCYLYTEIIEGKNLMLTLTITNADMYHRLHRATIAFSLLVLVIFISISLIAHSLLKNLWRLGEERLKNQHIEDELAIARKIQMSLMPSQIKGEGLVSQLDISGFLQPARFVGGDLYDYYVRDNKLIFCIGDISGKGVPAAMLMSISHSLFRTVSAHVIDPGRIVNALNDSISDNNPDCMFLTLFLGVIDLESNVLSYCNAGHNPPVWIHGGQVKFIDSEPDMILGVETGVDYNTHQLQMNDGDTLFLYTDGLSEAENVWENLFGEQKILEIAGAFGKITAEEQIGIMLDAVRDFVGEAEQSDDLTMLAISFRSCGDILVLDNDIQEMDKLEPFLNDFFERNKLDMSLLPQMDLALEEAIANVIMYAYPEGQRGTVEIALEMKEGHLQTCVSDAGTPFNPLQQPDAKLSSSIEERPIGGLGIHLIKEIMDEVVYQYKDGKNILTMIRKI
jgi:sigma-B regulation protein RsbU (phosphoserine phosphatase)